MARPVKNIFISGIEKCVDISDQIGIAETGYLPRDSYSPLK